MNENRYHSKEMNMQRIRFKTNREIALENDIEQTGDELNKLLEDVRRYQAECPFQSWDYMILHDIAIEIAKIMELLDREPSVGNGATYHE